jgi:FkbM family methyltransferase
MILFEKIYVKICSIPIKILNSGYSIALKLYPLQNAFFKGFWITKEYLNKELNLKINLFSKNLIDHKILFTGEYEKDTNHLLKKHIKLGDIVIEAGANTGTETLLISRLVGDKGFVFAFEPIPHIYTILKSNCELNNLENTTLVKKALGEKNSELKFYMADESFTNQGMGTKLKSHGHVEKEINVFQVSIDSFVEENNIQKVDFIKMDIQGAEYDALIGAKKLIEDNRPKIFLEAGEGWSSIEQLYDLVSSYSYSIYLVSGKDEILIEKNELIRSGNWIAIPKK